jgi:hypothetical protein
MHDRGKIRRGRANRNPLRRVVGEETTERGVVVEVLECGHRVHPREDFIGRTYATKRRCARCAAEQENQPK